MRVGLIIDSACDLPHEFSRRHNLSILPVTAVIDGQTYIDDHDPVKTQEFYESGLLQKGHHAETEAFSAQQIHDLFLSDIVTEYDVAICETVTRSRSLIYQNATEAMNSVMSHYREAREAAGVSGNFSMRVVDSKQLFAGQGLLAAHTLDLIEKKLSKNELRQQIESFTDRIYTCVIPRDLHYIRERARRRGDKSVSAVAAFLGKALSITPVIFGKGAEGEPVAKTRSFDDAVSKVMAYAAERVKAGLLTPYVCMSCGLSWEEINALPGLDNLREVCKEEGVELLLSQMGITSSIYVGPGSLCLALGAEDHAFSDFQ
ncbi:MAG: fatty acid-binding protein DegV [Alteromonadaceae bacterium]|nr:fatty acid-binding protein DegV [Alteromonadaceae bacterium]MBH84337.1 fatty acid-binding protein DegV [Alteromonadaceae bacterium]|tara:strand:- start:331 stop:1281 length:951 start_codon:yes stop_codon:yes gene_type:complete